MHVEVLQVVWQPVNFAEDGRERELDRLEEGQALLEDEALEQAVEVLRVGSVPGNRKAELATLLPQLRDGVDLAVVAEDGKWLHPAERGIGVGGVPVVRDDP